MNKVPPPVPGGVAPPTHAGAPPTGRPPGRRPTGRRPSRRTSGATPAPRSIQCVNCAGSLEIRDSSESAMIVCAYCGSAMDISQPGDAQLLHKYEKSKIEFPIPIGSKCHFGKVDYVVVGRVQYKETDEDGYVYIWDELQLMGNNGGYLFLMLENGHWTLFQTTRRRSEFPNPKSAYPKQTFKALNEKYTVFERSAAGISYVEGELSWIARQGDRIGYMDAIAPPHMLSAEWTEKEMEWYWGRYIPTEGVAKAFKISVAKLPAPDGVAPAQKFERSKEQGLMIKIGLAAFAALFVAFFVTLPMGKTVWHGTITADQYRSNNGGYTDPIDVPKGNNIYEVKVGAPVHNSWVSLGVAFVNSKDQVVMDADSSVSYYTGRDSDGTWTEGSKSDSFLVQYPGPDKVRLNVFGDRGVGNSASTLGGGESVSIKVVEGVYASRYLLIAAILCLLYPLKEIGRKAVFESKRWPVDDDDDDD